MGTCSLVYFGMAPVFPARTGRACGYGSQSFDGRCQGAGRTAGSVVERVVVDAVYVRCDFTSAQEPIADLKSADNVSTPDVKDVRIGHRQKAGWLSE